MIDASAATAMITRCVSRVPTAGISSRLHTVAPTIEPTVFAAYTRPTRRDVSSPRRAIAASANGKLAPHKTAAGSMASAPRTRSICRAYHALGANDGLMGQFGSATKMTAAAHAMATVSSA